MGRTPGAKNKNIEAPIKKINAVQDIEADFLDELLKGHRKWKDVAAKLKEKGQTAEQNKAADFAKYYLIGLNKYTEIPDSND